MNHKKLSKQQGLSLIEIMVAISILVIAFIALMYSYPFGLSINKGAENTTIASYLAQDKIEELHSLGYDNINTGIIEAKHRLSDDPSNYLYNFQRETEVRYVNGNLQVESADQGMKRISTTIFYFDAVSKTEKNYNITTLISQR
jgi:prepilin-type N-terminal cleavage/methylation domain-containing protein